MSNHINKETLTNLKNLDAEGKLVCIVEHHADGTRQIDPYCTNVWACTRPGYKACRARLNWLLNIDVEYRPVVEFLTSAEAAVLKVW
jgi:hypothetical protein